MMSTILDENRLNRLARQMQRGEEKAAEALYNELSGKVYGFCISRLRRKHLAEDITQEFLRRERRRARREREWKTRLLAEEYIRRQIQRVDAAQGG